MNSMRNKVQLIGHLGSDPESRQVGDDKKVVRFSLATNESYKNGEGEKITDTQWHNIVIWGSTGEIAEKYLSKGREVALEGKIVYRNWEDKEGVKKYTTEILVSDLVLLSNKAND
ncbi:MAG: single-stranded DNA-binding protein [Candidatus Cyclobacteriaceae bacterium M3_2C_046]